MHQMWEQRETGRKMNTSPDNDYERNLLTRYQILMQHRQHAERTFWSRIQVLHLIQAAVIGGSFYIHYGENIPVYFSLILLGFGILLTVILFILCIYDWKSATVNQVELFSLGNTLGITWSPKRRSLKMRKDVQFKLTAHGILYFVIILFIILDVGLFSYFLCN